MVADKQGFDIFKLQACYTSMHRDCSPMLGSVAMERQRICVCELDGWEVCKGLAEQVKLNSNWRCALCVFIRLVS